MRCNSLNSPSVLLEDLHIVLKQLFCSLYRLFCNDFGLIIPHTVILYIRWLYIYMLIVYLLKTIDWQEVFCI